MGGPLDPEHARSLPDPLRLLLEAAEGLPQERAWAEFLASYSRLILYVARHILRDHDQVMDRYAYVLERLREQNLRRLRTFAADGRGKFTTWLTVVVRRLCLDHDRLQHGRFPGIGHNTTTPRRLIDSIALGPEALNRIPDDTPSADEALEQKQLIERLDQAVAGLSASDQLLVSLRYRDERSVREIAALMGLPSLFHVYRRLNRVHAALRQALSVPLDREIGELRAAPGPSAVQ